MGRLIDVLQNSLLQKTIKQSKKKEEKGNITELDSLQSRGVFRCIHTVHARNMIDRDKLIIIFVTKQCEQLPASRHHPSLFMFGFCHNFTLIYRSFLEF